MSKPMIEKAKNFSLVVLFLSTVLLLYFFWGNISLEGLKPSNDQVVEEVPEAEYMIKPNQVVINFGADNYTVIPSGKRDLWCNQVDVDCMVKEIDRFGQSDNILVKEITYAQYQEVMKYRSIWAEFNYDFPLTDFCLNFSITKPQSYDVIETVTSIGYSTAVEKTLFIYDGKNEKYYRLYADQDDTDFEGLIADIETEGYNIYYPVSSYLGVGVVNNSLVPVAVESNLKSFPFRQETYSYQTEKINEIAEDFFGEDFPFTRTIVEDNGTVIYMYGYGQNVLIVNTDGSIEYKEELVSKNSEQSFLEALETAVQFVAGHGSWESFEGARLTPYLKDAVLNKNEEKGYRFIFGMEVNGSLLFYEEGDPIVVDVAFGQVTYYKRSMIDFDQEALDAIETYSAEEAFSAVNLIAQNYPYIYGILLQSGIVSASTDKDAMFDDVSSLIDNMQTGYARLANVENTEIQPVWVISIKNIDVFFDLYSAEPIGYSKE